MNMLTKNFSLEELTYSLTAVRLGIDNTPTPEIINNLLMIATKMEEVRDLLGKPITVNSGYRCPNLNKVIGGAKASAHMEGLACDFICREFGDPIKIVREISESIIQFDQLIYEGTWVHIGLAKEPRREILTAKFYGGKTTYYHGIVA